MGVRCMLLGVGLEVLLRAGTAAPASSPLRPPLLSPCRMSWLREPCWLVGGCMLSCFNWKRRNSFSFSRMVIWPCSTCSALCACSLVFTSSPSCPLRVCNSLMYSMAFSSTKPLFRLACTEGGIELYTNTALVA